MASNSYTSSTASQARGTDGPVWPSQAKDIKASVTVITCDLDSFCDACSPSLFQRARQQPCNGSCHFRFCPVYQRPELRVITALHQSGQQDPIRRFCTAPGTVMSCPLLVLVLSLLSKNVASFQDYGFPSAGLNGASGSG